MNWITVTVAGGLVLIALGSIVGAVMCRENPVEFTAMLGITSSVVTGAIGWLAKSPLTNGGNGKT